MKKIIFMIMIVIVISIMSLGYAALKERIDIELEASIDSTYRVEITSVAEETVVGDARSVSAASYTNDSNSMTATFNVGLTDTTDYITYSITITNYSTVDVKLNDVEITTTNSNIKTTKLGINNGSIILHGGNVTFNIKVRLTTSTSSEQTGIITVNPKYTRLKGGVGSVTEEVYTAYSVGDIITFAGSNWYVIKNSTTSEDYVTLLKQNVLTHSELTRNYAYSTNTSYYTMAYYWSSTCHGKGTFGNDTYDSSDVSECRNYNNYSSSKIKEFLEGTYINTLESSNLKTINDYKIRLITADELTNNLGWVDLSQSATESVNAQVPSWLYQNFGATTSNNVWGYWTMTPADTATRYFAKFIRQEGSLSNVGIYSSGGAIRPVINLYKNAI